MVHLVVDLSGRPRPKQKKSMSYGTVIFHSYVKFYVKLEEANCDLMIMIYIYNLQSYDYLSLWLL